MPLKNIQNKLHALDPLTYPRTAVIAYTMDPLELDNVIRLKRKTSATRLKAFYHSHPNHDAYFSAEDRAFAYSFRRADLSRRGADRRIGLRPQGQRHQSLRMVEMKKPTSSKCRSNASSTAP